MILDNIILKNSSVTEEKRPPFERHIMELLANADDTV
jgi:hypothetical protein